MKILRKYILTKQNAVQGVEINPISGNKYAHILDFKTKEIKDKWIGKYLFNNNENWKALFNKVEGKSFNFIDEMTCEFTIGVKEYCRLYDIELTDTNFDIVRKEMRTKDYIIMLDNEGEYTCWSLTINSIDAGNYTYTGYYDISINRDIKTLFRNDIYSEIIRATPKTWEKNNDPKITGKFKPITDINSVLSIPEEIGKELDTNKMVSNIFHIFNQNSIVKYYWFCIKKNSYNDPYAYVDANASVQGFRIKNKELIIGSTIIGNGYVINSGISDDTKIIITGNSENAIDWKTDTINILIPAKNETNDFYNTGMFQGLIKSKELFTCRPVYYYSLPVVKANGDKTTGYINAITDVSGITDSGGTLKVNLSNSYDYPKVYSNSYECILLKEKDILEIESDSINFNDDNNFDAYLKEFYNTFNYDNNINSKLNYKNFSKLYSSQFKKIFIKDNLNNEFQILQEYTRFKLFGIVYSFVLNLNSDMGILKIVDLGSDNEIYNNNSYEVNNIFIQKLSREYTIYTDEYINYLNNNRQSINQQVSVAKRDSTLQILEGLATAISGAIAGGVITGATLGAAAPIGISVTAAATYQGFKQIFKSQDQLKSIYASLNDNRNQANQILNSGTDIYSMEAFNITSYMPFLAIFNPPEFYLEKCALYFAKYGYDMGNELMIPNELIDNHYYYDFLQMTSINENFLEDVSLKERAYWIKTFEEGATIWHIRDLEKYKGIKNYSVNNVQTDLIE